MKPYLKARNRCEARADGLSKKSAAVMQAVVDDAQRQIEMDFVGQVPSDELTQGTVDEDVRTAVDGLNELEMTLKQNH